MSMKPDDIPQSIWDSAWGAEAWARACYDPVTTTEAEKINVVIAIARAIMAAVEEEREACAKIGDQAYDYAKTEYDKDPNDGPFTLRGAMAVGRAISKAIRNRQSKDG